MSLILSHPTGNANSRAVANSFAERGMLTEFHTSIASFEGSILDRLSSFPGLSEIKRRKFDSKLRSVTKMSPWHEMARLIASKAGMHSLVAHEHGKFSIDKVYRSIDKKVSESLLHAFKKGIKAVYAYEDEALLSFREARRQQLSCLYDLPTGYWRAARILLNDQAEKFPEWQSTLIGFKDSEQKLANKDEELKLADLIFVASSFTAKTLEYFPGKLNAVEVIPYGFPDIATEGYLDKTVQNRKLKLLFVGKLSQQKGIANVFEAVNFFKDHVELTLVGTKGSHECKALDIELAKHNWIPSLDHQSVLTLMKQHDVLLFPSLFDGFGLVITEAMSQGTPVIASERCAGPDLIYHGQNGWLMDAASTESLISSIEELLSNKNVINVASRNAMESARLRPWSQYGADLTATINSHLNRKPVPGNHV